MNTADMIRIVNLEYRHTDMGGYLSLKVDGDPAVPGLCVHHEIPRLAHVELETASPWLDGQRRLAIGTVTELQPFWWRVQIASEDEPQ